MDDMSSAGVVYFEVTEGGGVGGGSSVVVVNVVFTVEEMLELCWATDVDVVFLVLTGMEAMVVAVVVIRRGNKLKVLTKRIKLSYYPAQLDHSIDEALT